MALQLSQGKKVVPMEKKENILINSNRASSANGSTESPVTFREKGKAKFF